MFERELTELRKNGLLRQLVARSSAQGPAIIVGGKKYINFSSNDYLGLAGRPELQRAAEAAGGRFGFGSGASRLLAGGSTLHERLEKAVAAFKMTEAALLFNSGYAANTAVIPAIAPAGSAIFSDELNHASIIDGCRLGRARVLVFRHRDAAHLERLMKKEPASKKIVVTDSVFSMDGDIAPLPDLCEVCGRHGAILYLDDAHATGVLGTGKGSLAHFGLGVEPWIIQMGTFSKALGSFGAFVAGTSDIVGWLTNAARSFIFSTALPAPVVAASLRALSFLEKRPGLHKKLLANTQKIAEGLRKIGHDPGEAETPILAIRQGNVQEALALSAFLLKEGIYAPAIRPPTVSEARIRITVTAAHTTEQIRRLISTLEKYKKKFSSSG